jgi:hypothetical protein
MYKYYVYLPVIFGAVDDMQTERIFRPLRVRRNILFLERGQPLAGRWGYDYYGDL